MTSQQILTNAPQHLHRQGRLRSQNRVADRPLRIANAEIERNLSPGGVSEIGRRRYLVSKVRQVGETTLAMAIPLATTGFRLSRINCCRS
jgi:hypothetical protein